MPIDPFFTSAHKKHYINIPGVDDLYAQVKAMPYDERQKWKHDCWYNKRPTQLESIVLRRLKFDASVHRRARIHETSRKQVAKAIEEYKRGKRDRIIMVGRNFAGKKARCLQRHS